LPKPIKITITVEEVAAGAIYNQLDRMPGVVSINFHGDGPKERPTKERANGKGERHDVTNQQFFLNALLAHGSMSKDTARELFVSGNRSIKSLHSLVHVLKRKSLVVTRANGEYALTAKGKRLGVVNA